MDLQSALEGSTADGVVVRALPEHDAWIFIVLDDLRCEAAVGGTRLQTYSSPADGLQDAGRLAQGMTFKWAALGEPVGGAKGVIALARPVEGAERITVLQRYGELVEGLGGRFGTGPDLGITTDDLRVIASRTGHVHGVRSDGTVVEAAPFTAHGVLTSIEVALEFLGRGGLRGRSIWVEGVGSVGEILARRLAEAGARVFISDLDEERAAAIAEEIGGEWIRGADGVELPLDVYAPCAVGGTIDRSSAARLAARIVAGAANNVLADPESGHRLAERGVLYCPDFVVNGGGAVGVRRLTLGETDPEAIFEAVSQIGPRLQDLLERGARESRPPFEVAIQDVEDRLQARVRGPRGEEPLAR